MPDIADIVKKIERIIELLGFDTIAVRHEEQHNKIAITIEDNITQMQIARMLPACDHLFNLFLRKEGFPPHVIDINCYRKERERLITELARAAAHKAMITKETVELPPMNAYERRIVHVEIALHPELKTESIGELKERRVVVKPIMS